MSNFQKDLYKSSIEEPDKQEEDIQTLINQATFIVKKNKSSEPYKRDKLTTPTTQVLRRQCTHTGPKDSQFGYSSIKMNSYISDKEDLKQKQYKDYLNSIGRGLPKKFEKTKIKTPLLLLNEIRQTYESKKRKIHREIMIGNIKHATDKKIQLITDDEQRNSSVDGIRQRFPKYKNGKGQGCILPMERLLPTKMQIDEYEPCEFDQSLLV